ncbi:GntR family transcriptional regulator [Bacillus manliponensis]|uniref:GntR family transcriptional regulator n=1 Tax=Bacillus manliponensis TaxID=574376 RepID=UPI003518D154
MPIPRNFNKQERFSAKTIVLNQLQDWIIEGILKPDEKINDNELAEALGVSRTPVREALQVLELSGLVEMIRGQKTKIAPIKKEDIVTIYETIAGMHTIIGKQAMRNIKPEHIHELTRLNEAFKQAIEQNDAKEATKRDFEFHRTIASIANNTYIEPFLENLHLHALRLEYMFFKDIKHAKLSIEEHTNIIAALEKGDAARLEQLINQNWLRPMEHIQKQLAE